MTQDEIIRMAREAGVYTDSDDNEMFLAMPETSFEHFAALVAAYEREACAKVCEGIRFHLHKGDFYAAAIRARGEK